MRHKAHNQSSIVHILWQDKNLNSRRDSILESVISKRKIFFDEYSVMLNTTDPMKLTLLFLRDYSNSVSPFIFLEILLL